MRTSRRHLAASPLLSVLQLIVLLCFPPFVLVNALRHSFTTKNDARTVIGPVGVPFGFAGDGHYELQVFDFELTVDNDNDKTASSDDNELLHGLAAGFYLHRFPNDAAYTKYLNVLQSNDTKCSFEYFLDIEDDNNDENDDVLPLSSNDDMVYEEVGEVTSAEHGILLLMQPRKTKWKPATPTIEYTFSSNNNNNKDEAGLYYLTYQICVTHKASLNALKHVKSNFELDFTFTNRDASGQQSYLTAGELHLPFLFFFFAMIYLVLTICWIMNLQNISHGGMGLFDSGGGRPTVYPIHKLMAALLVFKFLAELFESIRYHVIRITGHAEMWSFVYHAMNFCKGVFLFTVILLIGTGWSFVKPFLNANEKRIIFGILVLQIINNLAIAVLNHETEGEKSFARWSAVLHLVDILCCCAVLLPIVWQVNALEKSLPNSNPADTQSSNRNPGDIGMDEYDLPDEGEMEQDTRNEQRMEQDREKGQILQKLKLFRSFYLLVVAYIYLTRIIVYLFATMLDYQHLWLRHAVVESVTLAFYVVVGCLFRPMIENPYLSVKQQEEDGIAMNTRPKSKGPSK